MMKRCERADEGEKRARAHGERRVQQRVTVRKEREREKWREAFTHRKSGYGGFWFQE